MSVFSSRPALVALMAACPLLTHAHASPVSQLDQIVVTPARSAQALDTVVGDISLIDREQLQASGQSSLLELLSRQADIQITDGGGRQGPGGVMIRGNNTSHTLVLLNGQRINSSMLGNTNFNQIDPASVERIEILRGAASSLYGSNAIGGVINIITQRQRTEDGNDAWANIGLGSQNTFKSSAGIGGKQKAWDYSFSATYEDSDGYNLSNEKDTWAYHPDKDGYTLSSASGNLGYEWAKDQRIDASAYSAYLNGDYDDGLFSHPATVLNHQQAYTLSSSNRLSDFWRSRLSLGLSKESYDSRTPNGWTPSWAYATLQRNYAWQNDIELAKDHHLSAIFERLEERITADDQYQQTRRNTNSASLLYRGQHDIHRWQASVRHDRISAQYGKTTGALAYDLDIHPNFSVGASANTGFQTPFFSQLYGMWGANPELQAETSRNAELRVQYHDDSTRITVTGYQNTVKHLIAWENIQNGYFNIDKSRLRGISLSGEHQFANTRIWANADFLQAKNRETGKFLPFRAKQSYRVAIEQSLDQLKLGAEYQYTSSRFSDLENTSEKRLGGFSLLNLTASHPLSATMTAELRWNNVLNKSYERYYGYNSEGSNVFLNLAWRM